MKNEPLKVVSSVSGEMYNVLDIDASVSNKWKVEWLNQIVKYKVSKGYFVILLLIVNEVDAKKERV